MQAEQQQARNSCAQVGVIRSSENLNIVNFRQILTKGNLGMRTPAPCPKNRNDPVYEHNVMNTFCRTPYLVRMSRTTQENNFYVSDFRLHLKPNMTGTVGTRDCQGHHFGLCLVWKKKSAVRPVRLPSLPSCKSRWSQEDRCLLLQ
jgi:hypothetical protein